MTESERRLAAIMFTDIVGYTSLTQDNEEGTMASLREHREVLRPVFERHGGREVKTIGDAFLVEFASSLEAVRCALEIQGGRTLGPGQNLKVRIGIHVGEVIHEGGDVFGDAVNIAARIEPLAEPGGICISRQVFDFVQKKVDAKLIRVGLIELKNVKTPMEIYRVLPSHSPGAEQMSESLRMRVAVLPFDNFSPETGDEYFADGLTEELIGTLSKIRELNVISRTSVMQYKGKPRPVSEIGKELNAGTILEGSVRKVGNRARVSIQLIDATEDRHVWAENYDRDLTDIFSVQSDIAGKVADALKVELLADEREEIGEAPTKNVEANLLFLKGLYEIDKGSQSNMMKGIDYFKQAVGKDPKFALAYSFIGSSYIALGGEILPAEEAFPKAKESIETALKLDPKLAQAHAAKGWAAFQYDWDFTAAEASLRTAIDLSPNLASAHHFYGRVLASLGRFDEAISEMTRAFELDPAATWVIDHYGTVYYMAGRYREAREMFDKVLRHNPTFVKARMGLAFVDAAEGNREAARIGADDAVAIDGVAYFQMQRALVHASVGSVDKAREILENLLAGKYEGFASPALIGGVYYSLGDQQKGYEWIRKALDERDASLPWYNKYPILEVERSDPRFLEILREIKLP